MTAHFMNLLDDLRRKSLRMASAVEDMVQEACEAASQVDHALAQRVIERDDEIDAEEIEVEQEVIRLIALFQPMGVDMRLLCAILKINNDLERIADCAVNIAERARHLSPEITVRPDIDVTELVPIVLRVLRGAVRAYSARDEQIARSILQQDEAIDALYAEYIRNIVEESTRARQPEVMAAHLDLLSIAKNLERIADHATNVAEDVIFLCTGQIVRHADAR